MSDHHFPGRAVAAGAIGTLCLAVGSIGVATASNGGSLKLGHSNTATKTTTLKDTHGTPLKLKGDKSKAPLKVNSQVVVKKLNAGLVDGFTAGGLVPHGSGANFLSKTGTLVSDTATNASLFAQTTTLQRGTFFVNATEDFSNHVANSGTFCAITKGASKDMQHKAITVGASASEAFTTAAESWTLVITNPEKLGLACYTQAASAHMYAANIQAIRIPAFGPGTSFTPTNRRGHRPTIEGRTH
jgi:hypothetical protein